MNKVVNLSSNEVEIYSDASFFLAGQKPKISSEPLKQNYAGAAYIVRHGGYIVARQSLFLDDCGSSVNAELRAMLAGLGAALDFCADAAISPFFVFHTDNEYVYKILNKGELVSVIRFPYVANLTKDRECSYIREVDKLSKTVTWRAVCDFNRRICCA